jgi:hypothetical protein
MGQVLRLGILFSVACGLVGCGSAPLKDAGPGFSFTSSIKFANTRALVRTYTRVRLSAKCNGEWGAQGLRVQGDIPPGMIVDGLEFSGSPVGAGSWLIQARVVKPYCDGVVYDDKQLWFNFTVEGERPRALY